MQPKKEQLGQFLREVSNWSWDEFVRAESDPSYTSNEAVVFALIRNCTLQRLDAIKLSLNRLDGKLKTPIKVEYPKIFYLYPNAPVVQQLAIDASDIQENPHSDTPSELVPEPEVDLANMTLRETLTRMGQFPRQLPEKIIELAERTEDWLQDRCGQPDEIPKVKSVVAASLLKMAHNRDISALTEVFDQTDGRLAETVQIIGEDIFITSYAITAPANATLNADGIMQAEATVAQDLWAAKLGREIVSQ